MNNLGRLCTIYGFATSIALIVSHSFKLPSWPFGRKNWNPKRTELEQQEDKEVEATEENITKEDSTVAAGGVKRRYVTLAREFIQETLTPEVS